MRDAFTFVIPAAGPLRSLAPEVAGRYAELAGGSAVEAAAAAAAVSAALERIANGAEPGTLVNLAFRPENGGVQVDLACDGRRESVSVTIPVAKR